MKSHLKIEIKTKNGSTFTVAACTKNPFENVYRLSAAEFTTANNRCKKCEAIFNK